MRRHCTDRGQSEVIGIVLLIGVVVTLILGAGAIVFMDWQSQTERETKVAVQSDLTATELTLQHMGGDSLEPEDVLVVLQGGSADGEYTLDANFTSSADRFEPGSTWRHDGTFDGEITVSVFEMSSNTELHRETYEVGTDGIRDENRQTGF